MKEIKEKKKQLKIWCKSVSGFSDAAELNTSMLSNTYYDFVLTILFLN